MFHTFLGAISTKSNCRTDEEILFFTRMMVDLGRLMKMTTLVMLSITLELSIASPMLVFLEKTVYITALLTYN